MATNALTCGAYSLPLMRNLQEVICGYDNHLWELWIQHRSSQGAHEPDSDGSDGPTPLIDIFQHMNE